MADEDIYEPFHISEWDLQNEFNPNRHKRKNTKNQQIYGIWASSESEDEEDKGRKGKGSKGPINFVSGGYKDSDKKKSDEEDSNDGRPSMEYKEKKRAPKPSTSDTAGLRHRSLLGLGSSDFGKWEAHTKGIGAKLLLQMGYKPGKGLGKNLQGRTDPIEAKKRPGQGALGLYGPENNAAAEEEPSAKSKVEKKRKKTKGDGSSSTPTTKYVYKLVDDLSDRIDNLDKSNELSKTKVIDMTGPEQRILSGYHEIHKKSHRAGESSESDEEQQAMDQWREDVINRAKREIKLEKERLTHLIDEQQSIEEIIASEKAKLSNIETIVDTITDMSERFAHNDLRPEEVVSFCEKLCSRYREEFPLLGLSDVLFAFLFPLLEMRLQAWNCIANASFSYEIFKSCKRLCVKIDETIYDQLMWDVWMPNVRRCLTSWQTYRQCDEVIAFLEKWKSLLPEWLLCNILEQIIIPLIEKEVQEWNPCTDSIPVHSWIHPWLPLMDGHSLENVYATIRHKLANALTNWHPSDHSPKAFLQPWQKVFSVPIWNSFLQQNIVPKLELVMQSYDVNPQAQRLDVWEWVMAWQEMLPTSTIAGILEKHFMPKWLRVLYDWLTNNPNFDEVSRWYMGWKSMFSDQLLASPVIKDCFSKALEMMNFAVSSPVDMRSASFTPFMPNPVPEPPPRYFEPNLLVNNQPGYFDANITFKQILERKAEEQGILFMPIANRYYEAKQVYKFGNATICIDQQVIFVYSNGQWLPTPLQTLIDSALINTF